MCAWNELLEHAEITVNLLRVCPAHPRMSAWEGLNGPYDYDAHPLAPPGTAVTIFETPEQRKSWDKHGIKGPERFCVECFFLVFRRKTRSTTITHFYH